MQKYSGITTKIDNNNNTQIMVRFMFEGKQYPIKNFTKLFGCKTKAQASKKLNEIKVLITKGQNPFIKTKNNLDEIFKLRVESKRLSKEWSEHTISNYELFYKKVLKKSLGHKKLNKITYEDLRIIIEHKDFIIKKSVWKNRLKQILNPIFKDAIKSGIVFVNPCDNVDHYKVEDTEEINSKTLDDNLLFLSQELYKNVKYYPCKTLANKNQYKCFLYMVILTARRIGELCQLRKEDCYLNHKKIISPANITKSKREVDFPIPDECIEYINSVESGMLFPNIKRASIYLMFQRLISLTDIELRNGKILSVHNTRDLLLNIMIENGIDSRLADYCLDHIQKGTIRSYISFSFKQKKQAFELYWNLVRNDDLSLRKEKFRKKFFENFEIEFEKAWEKSLMETK